MQRKAVRFMGDSRERLCEFPDQVRSEIGQALFEAQLGQRHPSAFTMQGLPAVEIVSDYRGGTYRGIKTPQRDLDLIRRRLAEAGLHFREMSQR